MKIERILLFIILLLGFILRVFDISNNPPALYWDEASLGYNSYSILTSLKDEHGETLPIARFIAFGDFKPPGYIYAGSISMVLFGVNEFAIRFPSISAGVGLILMTYLLTLILTNTKKAALLAAFLVSISPWAIGLSRGAFEANLAAFFSISGFYLFLKFNKNKLFYLPLSVVFFTLSFYTFNANRIIAPLLIILLFIYKFKIVINYKKILIFSIFLGIIMLLPSYNYLTSAESKIRFQEVSIFNNLEILEKSNERIENHGSSLISRVIHNRRVSYFREFVVHFFDHFKADYLFISGDKNPRFSTGVVGIFYFFESVFLLSGVFMLIKKRLHESILIFLSIIICLIPSSVAKETPHMLRTVSSLPYFYLILSFGFYSVFIYFQKYLKVVVLYIGFSLLYLFMLVYYMHILFVNYPYEWAGQWQYGYKQAVADVNKYQKDYDWVVITESLGRPYIYWLFYNKVNSQYYFNNRIAKRDWFGFWDVDGFGKYRFGLDQLSNLNGKILVVGNENELGDAKILSSIKSLDDKTIFNIREINK